MRNIVIEANYEDIVGYECNYPGKFVKIIIGKGNIDVDGNFVALVEQNYEVITIQGDEFDKLMAASESKPANVFRKEDLWEPVDKSRIPILQEKVIEPTVETKRL